MTRFIQISLFSFLFLTGVACTQKATQKNPWPPLEPETKPWSRWWWHGSQVNQEDMFGQMKLYADAGFGGMEITPIYGVQGQEENYLEFLSPEWINMVSSSSQKAGELQMGMDMNLGTGWPFGGPQISPELAASKLILEVFHLSEGDRYSGILIPSLEKEQAEGVLLEALMAYGSNGETIELTQKVNEAGILDWMAPSGEWELWAAYCGKTRQMVKRASFGGEGFTMDHFSPAALETYLDRFDQAFEGNENIRAFFNDSYEVYNASWTPGLFKVFQEKRSYDLRQHLDLLSGKGDPELVARVKSDYRETLSELLLESFTRPWTQWSHEHGSLTKNQAHGSPGNLIDLYAAVDIPECEIFGHREFQIPGMRINSDDTRNVEPNPMMLKLATSAAHISGKALISNETFTWLGEHFKVALSQCKPELEEAFLAGINHVFYHGTTYSPAGEAWPGRLFYASSHFGPTNTFWDHLGSMNQYISRCQSLLQSGTPDNEILVYWPVYDIWDQDEGMQMQLSVHNIKEWLVYPSVNRMAELGYSYDFISDALLKKVGLKETKLVTEEPEGPVYKALIIPACKKMPLATLEKILALAHQGATVIFESFPLDVPGYNQFTERRQILKQKLDSLTLQDAGQQILRIGYGEGLILQSQDLGKALEYTGIQRERIGDQGLKFIRRRTLDGYLYFLVNHGPNNIDAMIPLNTPAASVLLLDPQDGNYGRAEIETGGLRTRTRVQLQAGKTLFLRTYDHHNDPSRPWAYENKRLSPIILDGEWKLSFLKGGPTIPEEQSLDGPKAWTELGDSAMLDFSGTAAYTTTFTLDELVADRYILDLGKLHGSALIILNGLELGHVWSLPSEISLEDALRPGENELRIEVANLMANRIRYMDREKIPWKNFHDINVVNISYEPFDASGWDTDPSGLAGPVSLIPLILN